MRACTILFLACLLPAGSAAAQAKSKPDPKPKVRHDHVITQEDVVKLKASAEKMAHDVIVKIDHEKLQADARALAEDVVAKIDLAKVEAQAAAIALDIKKDLVLAFEYDDDDVDVEVDDDLQERVRPQQQWYQEDPADSLYRVAYRYFSRQLYRQAATRFAEVRSKFPTTRYFCDAAYYEAFSRYRLGTQTDLQTAYRVLDGMKSRCRSGSRRSADVPQLTARVNSALARLGDREAGERVRRAAIAGQDVCDTEERDVRIQALSALAQMDPATAAPVLRDVLKTKDVCSAPIRRQAINLVARRNDPEAVTVLGNLARNDPSRENQLEAVRALGRISNEAAYRALEAFFRSSSDERVQVEAARSMARNDDPRARATVRALVERSDVAERIRVAVISALASQEDLPIDYWRSLYSKLESEELRSAVVYALSRNDAVEARQFLLALARNPQESHATREAAISRVGETAPISDLYRIFTTADSRSMRLMVVQILAGRRESEATDRLIDIAKAGTDPEVRRAAINALGHGSRKDDPRVIRALGEIISRG